MQPTQIKVTVLLATFNGVRFLDEQLTSLNEQLDVAVEVFANDDGSTDETMKILEIWKKKGLIVEISESKGVGPTRAFFNLLQRCDGKKYVAFCDQDDIWHKSKLITQVNSISGDTPALSTSMRLYIDENGSKIGESRKPRIPPSFANAMFENFAPGNTSLLNNSAVKLINQLDVTEIKHYDSWMYLVISAFGQIKFIEDQLVSYRIHSNNSVGLRSYSVSAITESISNYLKQQELLVEKSYHQISLENQNYLDRVINFKEEKKLLGKLKSVFLIRINRQSRLETLIFRFLFLSKIYS